MSQLKTNYPGAPVLLLDTGNFSDNPTVEGERRTATLLKAMASLGYRAINVGERDLGLGYDDFKQRTKGIDVPFISSNIVKQGTKDPVFPPYVILDAKGSDGKPIRVGVLGVVRYNPVWQKAGPDGSNLAVTRPADAIGTYLPELESKSDVVVLLASIAKDDAYEIARRFPRLNLILGAYGGIVSTVDENQGGVRIYYMGNQGKRIGESRITLDASRRVADVHTYFHFLNARYPEDKAMREVVAEANRGITQAAQQPKIQIAPPSPGGS